MHAHLLNNVLVWRGYTTTSPTELSVNQGVYCTHVPRNASVNLYRHKTSTAPRLIYAAVSSAPAGTCAMIYSRAALCCAITSPPTAPTTLICMDYIKSLVLPYQLLLIIVLRFLQIRFTVYPGNSLTSVFSNKFLFSSLVIFIWSHMSTIILGNAYCMRACGSTCPSSTWCPHMRMK